MVVLVDPPFQMNIFFRSLFSTASKTIADVLYMVKKPVRFQKNTFPQILWNYIVWVGKRIPDIYETFPYIRLSKIFGGNDDHLLKMVSAARCFATNICFKSENEWNFETSLSDKISTVLPIDLSIIIEEKTYITSSTNEELDKTDHI